MEHIYATDVYIVFAKTIKQSKKIQKKMVRMGFNSAFVNSEKGFNDKTECYYIATIWHKIDGYVGNSEIRWGRSEVETSPFFGKRTFTYKEFMKI